MTSMVAASGEMDHILSGLNAIVTSMSQLPKQVSNSMRGISNAIETMQRQQRGHVAPGVTGGFVGAGAPGAVSVGSMQHQVAAAVRQSLQGRFDRPSLLGAQLPKPGIGSVPKSAIDKAGVDRIVLAIRAQTRVLTQGLKIAPGQPSGNAAPANNLSGSSTAVRKGGEQVAASIEDTAAKLQRVEGKLAQVIGLIGDGADAALTELKNELQAEVSSLKASARKEERSGGTTRTQQSDKARADAEAARKNRPTISDKERDARREAAALVASPGASDFDARLGRARTQKGGNYSAADLNKMVEAYKKVGILVERNARTTKAELADRLKAAHAEYQARFGPTGSPALQTKGLNVSRSTSIEGDTAKMLGDLTEDAKELGKAFDLLAADARSGGKRRDPAQRGIVADPIDPTRRALINALDGVSSGHINVPPNTVKGRRDRGRGDEVTEAEFEAASVRARADARRQSQAVLGLAGDRGFDPYSQTHDKNIKAGNSPEDIRLAQAARAKLRDTRLATKALDAMGIEFLKLRDALATAQGRVHQTTAASEKAEAAYKADTTDPAAFDTRNAARDDLSQAKSEIANIVAAMERLPEAAKQLFETPDYQRGLAAREGLAGKGYLPGVGSRQVQEARSEYYGMRTERYSDYRDVRAATVAATAGARTGMGTRQAMSPIPGLRDANGSFRPTDGAPQWSKKQTQKIDAATNALTKAQIAYAGALKVSTRVTNDSTASEQDVASAAKGLAEAEKMLDQAANLVANRLSARTMGGISPSFQALAGIDPVTKKSARDEARRQEIRDKAEDDRTRKIGAKENPAYDELVGPGPKASSIKSDLAALRAERAALQKGDHTTAQVKALRAEAAAAERRIRAAQGGVTKATKGGDADKISAAEKRLNDRRKEAAAVAERLAKAESARSRLKAIRDELGGAGGGKGSGGGGRTAQGGADGAGGRRDNDILRKILAKLNDIHGTLKGGVTRAPGGRVVESLNPTLGVARTSNPRAEVLAATTGTPAQVAAAVADQRKRAAAAKNDPVAMALAQQRAQAMNAKLNEGRARATQKSYNEEVKLAAALAAVSQRTRDQIAQLRTLIATGATERDISKQRLAVYRALDSDLQHQGVRKPQRAEAASAVFKDVTGSSGKEANALVAELSQTARAVDGFHVVDQAMSGGVTPGGLFGEQSAFSQAMFGNAGFWSRVMNSTGTFVVRNFTAGFVFGMTNALQEVIGQAIETEATFIRVSNALEAVGRDVGSLRGDLQGVASEYATPLNDIYETAAGLSGLFGSNSELVQGTEVVAQLQLISKGALSAQEAIGAIASIEAGFGDQLSEDFGGAAEGMQHIADVLTSVQNNIGTNAEITAEAVGSLSGLAVQLGLSYEEVAVYGAQIAKLTNQTGAAAGEQFSRILSTMQSAGGRNAIMQNFQPTAERAKEAGVSNNIGAEITALLQNSDYSGALRKMQEGWDALSESQQRNLTVALGGQRQARAVAAAFANGAKTLDDIRRAEDSYGAAQTRTQALMQTLNAQIKLFNVNLQTLASNLVRSGILNALGAIIMGANKLLQMLSNILSFLNDFADNTPFLGTLRDWTFGLLGFAAAAWVVVKAMKGMKASMAAAGSGSFVQGMRGTAVGPGGVAAAGPRRTITDRMAGVRGAGFIGPMPAPGTGLRTPAPVVDRGFTPFSRVASTLFNPLGKGISITGNALTRFSTNLGAASAAARAHAAAEGVSGRRAAFATGATRGASVVTGGLGRGIAGLGNMMQGIATGRGGSYFSDRAASMRERSQARMLASQYQTQRATDRGGDRALTRQAALNSAIGRTSGIAAGGLQRVSNGFTRLAAAGALADIGMMALTAAILFMVSEVQGQTQSGKSATEAIKKRYGVDSNGDGVADQKYERYVGPAQDAYNEKNVIDDATSGGFFGTFATLGRYAMAGFESGVSAASLGAIGDVDFNKNVEQTFGTEEGIDKQFGYDAAKQITTDGQRKLEALAKQPGVTAQQLADGAKSIQAIIEATARDMNASDDYSGRQKLAGAAMLEQATLFINDLTGDLTANVYGLSELNRLSLDQIERVNALSGTFGSLSQSGFGRGIGQYGDQAITMLLGNSGLGPDTTAQKLLAQMAQSTSGSKATTAALNLDLIDDQLQQAMKEFNRVTGTTTENGQGDPEEIEKATNILAQKIQDKANAIQQFLQLTVEEATTLSEAAMAGGDIVGAEKAVDDARYEIEKKRAQSAAAAGYIDSQEVMPGVGPGADPYVRDRSIEEMVKELRQRKGSLTRPATGETSLLGSSDAQGNVYDAEIERYNQMLRDLANVQIQNRANASSQPLYLQGAQQNDPLVTAAADTQKAGAILQGLKSARKKDGDAGATVAQINQAKIDYINATLNLARLADAVDIANMSADAAAIWNSAARSSAETGIAQQRLDNAIEHGTPEEQATQRGALAQAQMSESQSYEAQRAAARETQLAMVPPGDAVAVARMQIANAKAAQAYAASFGTNSVEYQQATQQVISAQWALQAAMGSIQEANAALAAAYANARGDAVGAARAGVAVAAAALATARERSGGARSAEVINAQAGLVAAHAAVQDAQLALIQSESQVGIALAEAAGHTVEAASRSLAQARATLAFLLKKSHGERTAEVNAARAGVIQAEASLRDAKLADELDTINFNLEMGRITQASAISALKEILRTHDLTKAQRRQLLLQIKGMQDEMADSQWNFGAIKLPTPYQMRRYIEERRQQFRGEMDNAAAGGRNKSAQFDGNSVAAGATSNTTNNYRTTIRIDGADYEKVKKLVVETVGRGNRTTTTAPRRRV